MTLPGRKGRLALHLALWALAGITLLILPALISPTASNSNGADGSRLGGVVPPSPFTATTASSTSQPNPGVITPHQQIFLSFDFFFRLAVVLFVAIAVSGFVMVLVRRRLRPANANL